jgi:inosine/guanosine/xanthosine phosphorylase family protein
VLKALGAQTLIVTNAAGSLREEFKPASIIMIKDHINFMGSNPLVGPNDDALGERFISMHDTYSQEYRTKLKRISLDNKIKVSEGVYIGVVGPSFETKSECRFFANIGADVVGMSTVPEVIAAIHCGLKVLAFSIVTNYTNLVSQKEHSQEEIRKNADTAKANLEKLVSEFVKDI